MQITWRVYKLELQQPFTISKGQFTHRKALIILIHDQGQSGLGECTEISYYGISLDHFIDLLTKKKAALESITWSTPATYYHQAVQILGDVPFLVAALDAAIYDLYGKINQESTQQTLQIAGDIIPPVSNYTIGMASTSEMKAKILAKPWPMYKIKLGKSNPVEVIKALRSVTDAPFCVDANGGWTAEDTLIFANAMDELNVVFIEQPMSRDTTHQLIDIIEDCPLPLIADESCHDIEDIESCAKVFDGINIKLMKSGGITPAVQMIKKARAFHLKVMIGCMTESSIGISAAAQLLPLVDYADLDGAMLLKKDIATGVQFVNGQCQYPNRFGLGCALNQPFHKFEIL